MDSGKAESRTEAEGLFDSYEEARPYLACRLANRREKALLEKAPYRSAFQDLVLVPCFYRKLENQTIMGCPVSRQFLLKWGIEEKQLFADAFAHMQAAFPARLYPMDELMTSSRSGSVRHVLLGLLQKRFPETEAGVLDQVAVVLADRLGKKFRDRSGLKQMWVLGNEEWLFGAVSLLYPGVLHRFAEQAEGSVYILPSSIHEVILLPEGGNESRELLYDMVRSANQKTEDGRKLLSDSVYYYDRNKMEIQTL